MDTKFIGSLSGHGPGYHGSVFDKNYLSPTITTCGGGREPHIMEINDMEIKVKQATKEGYINCSVPGVADLEYPSSETRRGRVIRGGQISPTLTTENIPSVIDKFTWEIDGVKYLIRIRKLTPKECWRLMDFTDNDYCMAETVNSNTQLYKEAGNSIVKNILVACFGQMIEGKENAYAERFKGKEE